MKIYAIRDRLIDYFMVPFAAPSDKQVMAAVATNINGDQSADIKAAPHQFEIWILAKVLEDGHIEPHREILCSCSQLVRSNVRTNAHRTAAGNETPTPEARGHGNPRQATPGSPGTPTDPHGSPASIPASATDRTDPKTPTGH